jgi:hypothetical protein
MLRGFFGAERNTNNTQENKLKLARVISSLNHTRILRKNISLSFQEIHLINKIIRIVQKQN